MLDLVEGGRPLHCRIDLATGEAKLSAENDPGFAPKAKTAVTGTGNHRVGFSNFDDQLLLWVDGKIVEFRTAAPPTTANRVFGDRQSIRPTNERKGLGATSRRPASGGGEPKLL